LTGGISSMRIIGQVTVKATQSKIKIEGNWRAKQVGGTAP